MSNAVSGSSSAPVDALLSEDSEARLNYRKASCDISRLSTAICIRIAEVAIGSHHPVSTFAHLDLNLTTPVWTDDWQSITTKDTESTKFEIGAPCSRLKGHQAIRSLNFFVPFVVVTLGEALFFLRHQFLRLRTFISRKSKTTTTRFRLTSMPTA